VIFIHVFIDAFNNYGAGWFEPFSHLRISFNAIYVADPFFSVWPAIACVALILLKRSSPTGKDGGLQDWGEWPVPVVLSLQ
jgi:inner membrane protein